MAKFDDIVRDIQQLETKLRELTEEAKNAAKNKQFNCQKCSTATPLHKLTLFDKLFYVSPTGCTDGDYWTHSEYFIQCPKCHSNTRFFLNSKLNDSEASRLYPIVNNHIYRHAAFSRVETVEW